MDKLTITIDEGAAGRGAAGGVRPLVTAAGAAVRAAVTAGACAWRKDGEPWQPLCPMVNRQLPGEFRLSQLFLAGIATAADDKAALKARLKRLCGRLGVSPAAMTQPVAALTPLSYHQLICALAILSPNPDIVLLPAASWLSIEEWRELLREFALCPKTLWPVMPPSTAKGPGAVAIDLAWTQVPSAPVGTTPQALRPQDADQTMPAAATPPAAQTMAEASHPRSERGANPDASTAGTAQAAGETSLRPDGERPQDADQTMPATATPPAAQSIADASRPRSERGANPDAPTAGAAQAAGETSPRVDGERPLPAGLELTTVAELPPALAAMFGDDDSETPVLWFKGPAGGGDRPTYDLSAALQDAGAAAPRAAAPVGGWRIAISAPADVVWGCLSRRRTSAAAQRASAQRASAQRASAQRATVAGGIIAVAAGVKLRWWQMTTQAVRGSWRWRLAAGANVALTQLAPDFDGLYDVFELADSGFSLDAGSRSDSGASAGSAAEQAAVVATVVEFAKTYHNQPLPSSWQELGAGSRLLRLWQSPAGLRGSNQAAQPAGGQDQKLTITNLPLSRPEPGGVPVAAMLAMLSSHGIAEPWDQLLAALSPKLRETLPMEYYVDLLTLLPHG